VHFLNASIAAHSALLTTLTCALLGMLLRMFSTVGRRELRGMWFFIVLALITVAASNLALEQEATRWAQGLENAATTLSVLAHPLSHSTRPSETQIVPPKILYKCSE